MGNFNAEKFLPSIKKTTILALFLLLLPFWGRVEAQTQTIKQGEVLLYPINYGTNSSAYFGGEKIPVLKYAGNSYAIVLAGVSKKPGNYYLRIKEDTTELEKKIIQVKRGNFKQVRRGIPYKFNTLSKDKQASIAQDKAPLLSALGKASIISSGEEHTNFINPLQDIKITSPFGYKRIYNNHSTTHQGVDLKADIGTAVYAISDGEVLWGEGKSLYLEGPMVVINHGDGIVSEYLHLSKVSVEAGAVVHGGDIIGYSGDQGADVSGAHLHFAIKVGKTFVDPLQFIKEFQKIENKPF